MAHQDGLPTSPANGLPTLTRRVRSQSVPRPVPAIPLSRAGELWLANLRALNASQKSVQDRAAAVRHFGWWLEHEASCEPTLEHLTSPRVREFLNYCREANPKGRFGCSHPNAKRAARPSTIATLHRDLKAFARFCAEEEFLQEPLRNLKAPRVPQDQIEPLTQEEVQKLLDAARSGYCPERDRALMLVLLDSGMRLGELLSLTIGDVADDTSHLTIVGKGNKKRAAFLGRLARKALRSYLLRWRGDAASTDPLFVSVAGNRPGEVLRGDGVRPGRFKEPTRASVAPGNGLPRGADPRCGGTAPPRS